MKLKPVVLVPALLIASVAFAGEHWNYFKTPVTAGPHNVNLEAVDVVASDGVAKMKLKLNNLTKDKYLLFEPNQVVFKIGGQELSPKGKLKTSMIIEPKKTGSKVLEVTGGGLHVDDFQIYVNGMSWADTEGVTQEAEAFRLPPETHDFEAGNFECELAGSKQKTKETVADFKCTYMGDHIGIVRPGRLQIRVDGDQSFPNDGRPKTKVLFPGDSVKISTIFHVPARVVDMQFATMYIDWGKTFTESEITGTDGVPMFFELDPGLTAGKN